MSKRDAAPVGAPCWIDLFTHDTDAARAFYADVFGWTSEDAGPDYGGYINFSKDGVPVAGCMRNDGEAGTPDAWNVYLAVADAKETVDGAAEAGGQVIVPAMDVAELGRMAVVTDVGGAAIGIWQPGLHAGFGVLDEPGAPSWFELHTRSYDESIVFYRTVFGWDISAVSDVPEFRYSTLGEGDDALAGVMDAAAFLPEGFPAHWSVYFGVDDVDTALARIADAGGATTDGPDDTPYGRLATVTDPTGARFKLRG